jgi:hypothetical protein
VDEKRAAIKRFETPMLSAHKEKAAPGTVAAS